MATPRTQQSVRIRMDSLERENERMREALEFVTKRGLDSFGCPGEEQHGRGHKDVVHVAPYHCEQDEGCPICSALSIMAET